MYKLLGELRQFPVTALIYAFISFPFAFLILSFAILGLLVYSIYKIVGLYHKIDSIAGPIIAIKQKD